MTEPNWKRDAELLLSLAVAAGAILPAVLFHIPPAGPWGSPSSPFCPQASSLANSGRLRDSGGRDLQLHLAESNQKCEYSPSLWHTSSEH